MYKPSYYNYYFFIKDEPYVYNLLSTAIAKLDTDLFTKIEKETNNISSDVLGALIQEGFVVENSLDEKKQYQYFYDSLRFGEGTRNLHIMFIPTYECNLRCPYCYEGNNKNHKVISPQNVDAILSFVQSKLENNDCDIAIEKMNISLYGGEPMYDKERLIQFCDGIEELAIKFDKPVSFDMTSNFTLLTDSMVDLIKKHKIRVQVSIDGTKDEHDKRRIYANGQGTYDKILKNLEIMYQNQLSDLVTIRLNIDQNNIKDIEEQIGLLKKYSNDIYFGYLTRYSSNSEYQEKCIESCEHAQIASVKLHKMLQKNDLQVPQRFGKKAPCSMNSRNKFIIDCNLDVYKCELLVGNSKLRIGKLTSQGELITEPFYFDSITYSPFNFSKCVNCKFLPMCGAGCPSSKFLSLKSCETLPTSLNDCCVTEEDLRCYLTDYVERNL